MPFPVIIGGIVLGAMGATGVALGADGVSKLRKSKKRVKKAKKRHARELQKLELRRWVFNRRAERYGDRQLEVATMTIARFIRLLENQPVHRMRLDIRPSRIERWNGTVDTALGILGGTVRAAGAGVASSEAAVGLVGLYGAASTGTSIASLSGAAATNATLAWLGGGSLAAGGGGMAVGSVVLGGIAIAPATLVGGLVLSTRGQRALTRAREIQADVAIAIAEMRSLRDFLDHATCRIDELEELLCSLALQADRLLAKLETARGDAVDLRQLTRLVDAIVLLLATPVLTDTGDLNHTTLEVILHTLPLLES